MFKKNKLLSDIVLFFVYLLAFYFIVVINGKLSKDKVWEFNYSISPVIVILFANKYLKRIPVLNKVLMFIGSHSLNIFLIHTFIRYVYLNDFIYSFEYAILIPFILLAMTLVISIIVELLKKLLHYDILVNKMNQKLFSK